MQTTKDLLKSLYAMAMLVEARDAYTGGHLWRVSRYAYLLAQELGLPESQAQQISLAGFLHDLGKVGVPDAILNKPGKLTDQEYDVIKTHPSIGAELLREHPLAEMVLDGIAGHHERPDGKGYPQGVLASDISVMASVISIADAFDAMTSVRPYRAGMPIEQALGLIEEALGTQFNRQIGDVFLKLGRAGVLNHIAGHSEPGIPLLDCPACGPIIVQATCLKESAGTLLCPACTGEFRMLKKGDSIALEFTGSYDPVEAKKPKVDHKLVDTLVQSLSYATS